MSPGRPRTGRRYLWGVAAGLVAALGAIATAGSAQTSPAPGTLAVPVDRQDYVTAVTTTNPQDGSTVDPYDGDPSSIHVAVNGGKEFARSFVHLALDYLPPGAQATDAVMILKVTGQSDASNTGVYPIYNVNSSQAIIQACVLTTELPRQFNPSQPPAYNCELGSAIGKASTDGQTWTFDLRDLVAYWDAHGNTGAALIPISSESSSQTWGVAFYKSRSAATAAYAPGAASASPAAAAPAAGSSSAPSGGAAAPAASSSNSGSSFAVATPGSLPGAGLAPAPSSSRTPTVAAGTPTASPAGAAGAAAAPAPAAGNPSGPASNPGGPQVYVTTRTGSPVWPWVLLGCVGLAVLAVGWANRQAVLAALPRSAAIFRTHPRAYAVAVVAVTWGLVFGAYSAATGSSTTHRVLTASGQGGTGAAGGQGATGSSLTGPGGGSTGGLQTATGSNGGLSATAGGGYSTGPGASGSRLTGSGSSPGGVASGLPSASSPAATEFGGQGTWKTIDGIQVFFPAAGGPPVAQLYSGADDTEGLTSNSIRLCAHAALTYGAAFHISASDLDVYWHKVNDSGGIFGRKIVTNYQNDNYDPGTAVQAAQACKDWGTFLLIGGIGFDQIPAVRQWAEQNHILYLHHIATIEGTQGLRYSFSALPTVEQVGTAFGEVAARQFPRAKVGIIYRQSSNWTPGVDTFTKTVQAAGLQVVGSYGVQINQGNYVQELTQLRTAGAQVVLSWENALAEVEMIKQAQAQNWHPAWLINPFNLITNTLGSTALDQDLWGAAEWEAYDPNYYGGGFSSYADQIHEFEAEYKQYDPGADLTGDGGDLLFLNWESQKYMDALFTACGPNCTRNKIAGLLLAGFSQSVPPNCNANFGLTADHHHGGYLFSVLHDIRDPNGRANFVPVARCVPSY